MKTITIKQPWANLICSGVKDIENRTWPTKFRGRVLVHAGAKSSKSFNFSYEQSMAMKDIIDDDTLFLNSAIIGSVEIVDCVLNHPSIWAEKDTLQGEPIIYNWVLANPEMLIKPILNVKGKLSFWDYPITEEEYLNMLKIGQPIPESVKRRVEENHRYWRNGGHNGPTGHGDICYSDADQGL